MIIIINQKLLSEQLLFTIYGIFAKYLMSTVLHNMYMHLRQQIYSIHVYTHRHINTINLVSAQSVSVPEQTLQQACPTSFDILFSSSDLPIFYHCYCFFIKNLFNYLVKIIHLRNSLQNQQSLKVQIQACISSTWRFSNMCIIFRDTHL